MSINSSQSNVTPKSQVSHRDIGSGSHSSSPQLSKCESCNAVINMKDKAKHYSLMCKRIAAKSKLKDTDNDVDLRHCGFILDNVIHASVVNSTHKINDEDYPQEIASHLKNSIVLMHLDCMSQCLIHDGDWLMIESLTSSSNQPQTRCCIAMSSQHIKHPFKVSFLDQSIESNDVFVKITKLIGISSASSVTLCTDNVNHDQYDYIELMRSIRSYLRQRCILKGMSLTLKHEENDISLTVTDISFKTRDMISSFDHLSLNNSLSDELMYCQVSQETMIQLSGELSQKLTSLSDIGGYQSQISSLKDLIELPLKNVQTVKQIGILPPRGVLLFGPPGTGKSMTIKALMNAFCSYVYCLKIDSASILCKSFTESEAKLKKLFSDSIQQAPSLLFFDNIEIICSSRKSSFDQEKRLIAMLNNLLDDLPSDKHVVVIAATNKPDSLDLSLRRPGRFDREVEFPIPLAKERFDILEKILSKVNFDINKEELLSLAETAHSFSGADLMLACKEASLVALKHDKNVITKSELELGCKMIRPSAMREITLEVPKIYWNEIGGMEIVKKKLIQCAVWPLKNPEAFTRLGIAAPRGVLMYGPPGCCKTMIGKALATESGLNFLAIKGPELFNKWVGESERGVREVFRKAKQASPSILFFDEIDALAAERGNGQSTVGDRVLAQMLTELDGIEKLDDVIIVAATNRPDMIDKALLRPGRLDSIIYVPLPDEETRREIFRIRTRKMPLEFDDDLESMLSSFATQTDGYSGAEIAAVCQEAGLIALEENIDCKCVKGQHFAKSIEIVKPRTTKEMRHFYDQYHSRSRQVEKV